MVANLAQQSGSVSLAAQDKHKLRTVFQSLTAHSCPTSFNFHLHTIYSDGKLHPEALLGQAMEIGLQGLAITDHHSVQGYHVAQNWLNDWQQSATAKESGGQAPHLWTGVEINAELLGDEVHILAYAFDPTHPALQIYLQRETIRGSAGHADQVIASIHASGGLAVLAHPARYRLSAAELVPAAAALGIDAIETYYAYNNPTPWQPSPRQTEEVYQLGKAHGLLHTCGTDTHGMNLLKRL